MRVRLQLMPLQSGLLPSSRQLRAGGPRLRRDRALLRVAQPNSVLSISARAANDRSRLPALIGDHTACRDAHTTTPVIGWPGISPQRERRTPAPGKFGKL